MNVKLSYYSSFKGAARFSRAVKQQKLVEFVLCVEEWGEAAVFPRMSLPLVNIILYLNL